ANAAIAGSASGLAEGQSFEISPFSMTLQLPGAARIVALRLVNSRGETQDIDASPYATPAGQFEVELPVLVPHGYRLYWRVRDARGEEGVGSVGFVVRGCEDERRGRVAAR
ncbi:MAG: hypothetical protein EBZ50_13610, partial [Alphaproteobacteria bacterium]|nr:hypothetical protein [Alphaproteobacteria bacterium]